MTNTEKMKIVNFIVVNTLIMWVLLFKKRLKNKIIQKEKMADIIQI